MLYAKSARRIRNTFFAKDLLRAPKVVPMARDYVARHPQTGRPLAREERPSKKQKVRKITRGPWSIMAEEKIIPLAMAEIPLLEMEYEGRKLKIGRPAAIRALPRLVSTNVKMMHSALVEGLSAKDPEVRLASIEVLPICAQRQSESLFDLLAELLDDDILMVRQAASRCLGEMAPDFPSGTDTLLHIELRHSIRGRRNEAWKGLRSLCHSWPDVAADHIDRLIREKDAKLRRDAAGLLTRLVKNSGAKVWDLIIWSLQDEDDEVRRRAANTLRPLAENQPKVALLMAESALFDTDERVRSKVLNCLNLLDSSSTRLKNLISDGCRVADVAVRRACIGMIPRLYSQESARELAIDLMKQETVEELRKDLEELIVDKQLEGDESTKNSFLAPAEPIPARDQEILASMQDLPPIQEEPQNLIAKKSIKGEKQDELSESKSQDKMRQD